MYIPLIATLWKKVYNFPADSALRSPAFFRKKGDLTRLVIDAEVSGGEIPVTVTLSL